MKLTLIFGGVLLAGMASATVFDLKTDFSTTVNPNGAWRYGSEGGTVTGTTLAPGTFTLNTFSTSMFGGLYTGWTDTASDTTANTAGAVAKSNTATVTGVAVGDIVLHGAPSNASTLRFAVVRWTAPTAGTITSLTGTFGAGDTGNADVFVFNGATQLFGVTNSSANQNFSFTNIAVTAGQTFDFIVGSPSANPTNNNGNSTPTTATFNFQPVPEPTSIAALGLGAIALLRRRNRK